MVKKERKKEKIKKREQMFVLRVHKLVEKSGKCKGNCSLKKSK